MTRHVKTPHPLDGDEVSLGLELSMRVPLSMGDEADISDDPGAPIRGFTGRVSLQGRGAGEETTIGQLEGYLVGVDEAIDQDIDLFEMFDTSQTLCSFGETLFDFDRGCLRKHTERALRLDVWHRNFMIFDSLVLNVAYQGRGLGKTVITAAVRALGTGCGFAAIEPYPMQHGGAGRAYAHPGRDAHPEKLAATAAWRNRYCSKRFVSDAPAGRKKLQAYWGSIGFRRVGRTNYFVKPID